MAGITGVCFEDERGSTSASASIAGVRSGVRAVAVARAGENAVSEGQHGGDGTNETPLEDIFGMLAKEQPQSQPQSEPPRQQGPYFKTLSEPRSEFYKDEGGKSNKLTWSVELCQGPMHADGRLKSSKYRAEPVLYLEGMRSEVFSQYLWAKMT